jgi:biopolymer transport protein ExbD
MKLKKKKANPFIPQDSMADIAFLLIIFFMLTTTFSVNKGFDFGIPPLEASTEQGESRPALTIIVDSMGDPGRNYRVIVVDEQGNQQDLNKANIKELFTYVEQIFEEVKAQQPDTWYKLPVYILVRQQAPFEGFVDVWEEVQKIEEKYKNQIPEEDEAKKKLATHIPHVNQVEEIISTYIAQGKLVL